MHHLCCGLFLSLVFACTIVSKFNTPLSLHHGFGWLKVCHLSDADIDSLIDDAIPKNTKKATAWGISVMKGKVANFKVFIQDSWGVFACCQQFCQLCAVHSIWTIKMLTHSLFVNYWDLPVLGH